MADSEELKKYKKKVEELEEEVYRKRDALTAFVFNYVVENYGTAGAKNQKSRERVIEAFAEVYAHWRDI